MIYGGNEMNARREEDLRERKREIYLRKQRQKVMNLSSFFCMGAKKTGK